VPCHGHYSTLAYVRGTTDAFHQDLRSWAGLNARVYRVRVPKSWSLQDFFRVRLTFNEIHLPIMVAWAPLHLCSNLKCQVLYCAWAVSKSVFFWGSSEFPKNAGVTSCTLANPLLSQYGMGRKPILVTSSFIFLYSSKSDRRANKQDSLTTKECRPPLLANYQGM